MPNLKIKPVIKGGCRLIKEEGGGYIYDEGDGSVKVVNETAYKILSLCDGKRTLHEIIIEFQKQYSDKDRSSLLNDIISFIQKASETGVIKTIESDFPLKRKRD